MLREVVPLLTLEVVITLGARPTDEPVPGERLAWTSLARERVSRHERVS